MRSTVVSDSRVPQSRQGGEQHLQALFGWLQRLVAWQIALTRHTYGALADDQYRGLYVPDAEIDILSAGVSDVPEELGAQRLGLAAEWDRIDAWAEAVERDDVYLPLLRLGRLYDLSPFERNVLLLALAPELDRRYERCYAYIQDDVTRKRPAVDLALQLLCSTPDERRHARMAFTPDAPLLRHHLIELFEDGVRQPSLLARFIKLDDRIVAELLGQPTIDPVLTPFVTLTRPRRSIDDMVLPVELVGQLRQALAAHPRDLVLALQGGYGSGRGAMAEALCAEQGIALLKVSLDGLLAGALSPIEATRRLLREGALAGAAILWQEIDRVLHDDTLAAWRIALLAAVDEYPECSFLPLQQPWEALGALRNSTYMRVELPVPSFTERERLWRNRLNGDAPDDATLQALASTFRLTGGQIRDAVAMARGAARRQGRVTGAEDLYAAGRAQSTGRLDNLARKITTTYTWDDIVLPADQLSMLREVCAQVRNRRTVLERWGFDRHLAMGKGVNVLFAGPSGTGKTMAAEIIAADLGLALYKVDLSTMVSKYIGETEKNLDRVFTAAREANAILFFDEADALFGKRSEVKDAHDRYANIEVGYLLQKMEEYDGIVVLSTNLRKNLDDAFVRRLHVAIDFPFPEEPDRLRIWHKVFPPEAPLREEVDLRFIAKQFKLAGGNIRNVALLSAYLAAEEGTTIGMPHVMRAVKREYQKLGKLVTEAEFGRYLGFVRG